MTNNQIEEKIVVFWSKKDDCFVASVEGSDLIGCGDTKKEAIQHLKNHLKDEEETPRKRKGAGRPPRGKQKIAPEVDPETIKLIKAIQGKFPVSQGDILDQAVLFYSHFVMKLDSPSIRDEIIEMLRNEGKIIMDIPKELRESFLNLAESFKKPDIDKLEQDIQNYYKELDDQESHKNMVSMILLVIIIMLVAISSREKKED